MERVAAAEQHSTLVVERSKANRTLSVTPLRGLCFDFRPKRVKFLFLGLFWLFRDWLFLFEPSHYVGVVRCKELVRVSGQLVGMIDIQARLDSLLVQEVSLAG